MRMFKGGVMLGFGLFIWISSKKNLLSRLRAVIRASESEAYIVMLIMIVKEAT